jgi:hypothetical protein
MNFLKKIFGAKADSSKKDQSCCQVKIVEVKETKKD